MGLSVACGLGVSFGEGVGVSVSSGVGEALCRFFTGVGDSSGVGVGELFLRCPGDAEGLGLGVFDAVAGGECFVLCFADGLGDGEDVFFLVDIALRCLRGDGVAVGSKTFLILSPSDSSADWPINANVQTPAMTRISRAPSFLSQDLRRTAVLPVSC